MPDRIRASRQPLPTLIVPRGTRQAVERSDHTPEVQPRGTSLSKLQIRELAAILGPIQAVLSLGSGDLPVSQGAFSLPIALTNTDDSAWVKLRVKTAPTLLSVRSMEVWKVD
jgi:hypothetical protein